MSPSICPRIFEVEALRDGRLTGTERTNFERHLATCPACASEAAALDLLGRALRTTPLAGLELDELKVRRERTRLLAAFDQTLVRPPRRPWLARAALVACCAALALIVAGSLLRQAPVEPPPSSSVTASRPLIQADPTARWSQHTRAGRELVVLDQGELRIRTNHTPGAAAFAVLLPDGELEDIGTTFSVAVSHGRTERVHVEEGSVILKLRGRAPVLLHAGESWQVPSPEVAAAPLEVTPPVASTNTPARTPPPTPPPNIPAAPKASSPPGDAASNDFRAALAAFNAGAPGAAALKFRRFGEQHPSDPRAEDAAYLRVLALERSGDVAGQRAAARAYLRRYPAGFRRTEVERLGR